MSKCSLRKNWSKSSNSLYRMKCQLLSLFLLPGRLFHGITGSGFLETVTYARFHYAFLKLLFVWFEYRPMDWFNLSTQFWKVCKADTPCILPVTNRWTLGVFHVMWSVGRNFGSIEYMTYILMCVCMYLCMPAMCLIDITHSGWHLDIRWRLGQYSFILLTKTLQLLSN